MSSLIEKKRQYTRDMIIEAAEELFSRHGYHNTQVMDIVKSVGMSAGTFYNYYTDKRDLFEQITRRNFEDFRARIRKLREPVNIWDRSDRFAKLDDTFSAYFDYIDGHRQQFLILLRGSFGVDEELDGNVWRHYSDIAQDLADDLQTWLNVGIIEGVNPHTLAYAVVGMAMHLGHSYLMEQKFTREEAIKTLTSLSNTMFESYLTEAGRKSLENSNDMQRRFEDEHD
ncbi:MAG: TetR/AcrR family transcriptional regulator [Desulfobacterota bacterium]|jgi:AcrR family transcriptional regulator|nr:TetR/AcrR family transcriptional regulator [Thermodesulfobacteriota bacterium]